MCQHLWTYRNGRSYCETCGAWALDLRCYPHLRRDGGQYPTMGTIQNYACAECWANIRARMVDGELVAICDNGHNIADVLIISKAARDYRVLRQEADAVEVLDGLPQELRALVQ